MAEDRMKKDGVNYQMNVSIDEVGRGDVVKVGGQLERIVSIERSGKWDREIRTESGGRYGMMQINAYGKRIEKEK